MATLTITSGPSTRDARVELDGQDITRHLVQVNVQMHAADVLKARLDVLAADGLDIDVETKHVTLNVMVHPDYELIEATDGERTRYRAQLIKREGSRP